MTGPDDEPPGTTPDELHLLVERQKTLLIAVATGGPSFDDVDSEYKRRRSKLVRGLKALGLEYPVSFLSLWDWYGHYSESLDTYASRRRYIGDRFNPLLQRLEELAVSGPLTDWSGGSAVVDWPALETRLRGLRDELAAATDLDGWQDVGRRSREIIKDAVNLVFQESMVVDGSEQPKQDDVKRRLDFVLSARFEGSSHEETRGLLRKALRAAHKATHAHVERMDAFVVAQATVLVVRTLQELAGESEDSPSKDAGERSSNRGPWATPPPPMNETAPISASPPPPPSDDDVPF